MTEGNNDTVWFVLGDRVYLRLLDRPPRFRRWRAFWDRVRGRTVSGEGYTRVFRCLETVEGRGVEWPTVRLTVDEEGRRHVQ